MSPQGAEARPLRVAVVGAESPCGAAVREALAAHGVPGARVDLFGSTSGEAVLSEYDGEARLLQVPTPGELAGHGRVFVCDRSPAARGVLEDRLEDALVLDLAGARPPGSGVPVVHPDINPQASASHRGLLAVPHPVAAVLARVLHPIERCHGIRHASALVARPASDFGERGLEELRDQTVSLLRFADPPRGVFGRQLAFNVIPESCLGPLAEPDLDARVSAETAAILAWGGSRLALGLLAVPVFYGHVVAVRVEVERPATVVDLVSACREGGLDIAGEGRGACTPVDAAGERGIALCDLREDGLGGFWLWCVAGEAVAAAAELALRLAGLAATPEERRA